MTEKEIEQRHYEIKKKVGLILVRSKYKFFNIILHKFHWKLDFNCSDLCYGYIRFENKKHSDVSDGCIYINSKLIENEKFNEKHYLFILLHELFHILLNHIVRMQNKNPDIWNMACDHVVNNMISNLFLDYHIEPLDKNELFIIPKFINNLKISSEEIYKYLIKKMQNSNSYKIIDKIRWKDQNNDYYTTLIIQDESNKTKFKITYKEKKHNSNNIDEKRYERFHKFSNNLYNQLKKQGSIPSNIYECFEAVFQSNIPWQDILLKTLKKYFISEPNSRGWSSINKLFYPHGYILPGLLNTESIRKHGICIICVDTSGSISQQSLQIFANIIAESIDYFNKIIILTHDVHVHQNISFNELNDKQDIISFLSSIGLCGRGGTSHHDVFKKIQDIYNNEIEDISLILSLTDGYSDIDQTWNNNNWSKQNKIPTYFIIEKNGSIPHICSSNKDISPFYIQINE